MRATFDKIIVKVDPAQKSSIDMGGQQFLLAKQYNHNRREQHPVLCEVIQGNSRVNPGKFLLVHHNRFAENSPHEIGDGLYSIPYNSGIFASLDDNGDAHSLCGNIIAKRVQKVEKIEVAAHLRKDYHDRVIVQFDGYGYKKGAEIFTFPFSDYEIVYVWKGEERRVVKVFKDDICGILFKK